MPDPSCGVPMLARRTIEARFAQGILEALTERLGESEALRLLEEVVDRLALQAGKELALRMGGHRMEDFARGLEAWSQGGAYDLEELELSESRYRFDITRCDYAAMYEALGLRRLGSTLSCRRDFKLVEGFDPAMRLTRTGTIMEGADRCDFCIERIDGGKEGNHA